VTDISHKGFSIGSFFAGALVLLCALTFYYFAVLRIDYSKTMLLDLGPHPDATEYFAQAKALERHGWPSIQIGYEKLPSRPPFGYPVLMLPWLKMLSDADAVLAPFRTNQTLGLLLLLAVFAFYTYLAMPLTGGFAVLLLATLPGFFTFCRSSLSDVSASVLNMLAFMFAYLGVKEERRWKIYLSAVLLGLSLNVRFQSLLFAPLLLAMALFPMRGLRWRWLLHCAVLPVVFILAAGPLLVLNTIQFHSPFKTGYDFWAPYFKEYHLLFSIRYIPNNAINLWKEFTVQPLGYHTANIFGTGTTFVPTFLLLVCIGLFFIRIDRFVMWCAFPAVLTFLAVVLSHNDKLMDIRYYLPLLILLVTVALLPVTWAVQNILAGRRVLAAAAVFVLFGAACLGFPSRSGYNTREFDRLQAWDALHFGSPPRQSTGFIAQGRFLEDFGKQPGIVLSDIDPVYLNSFFPSWIVAAPLDGQHRYKWSDRWHYGQPQALALVEHGLQENEPVYALFVSRQERDEKMVRLPHVDGYEWVLAEDPTAEAAILKLSPGS
jgi:hypothetical protein